VALIEGGFISIDWWRLRLNHTIGQLDDRTILSGNDRFEGKNIVRGPVDPAFPNLPGPIVQLTEINENLGTQSASGTDLTVRYRS
jgi:iron complex outermembrane receptor protein